LGSKAAGQVLPVKIGGKRSGENAAGNVIEGVCVPAKTSAIQAELLLPSAKFLT